MILAIDTETGEVAAWEGDDQVDLDFPTGCLGLRALVTVLALHEGFDILAFQGAMTPDMSSFQSGTMEEVGANGAPENQEDQDGISTPESGSGAEG